MRTISVPKSDRRFKPRPAGPRRGWTLATASACCLLLAAGCRKPQGTTLGRAPNGEVRSILAVLSGDTPPQVTVSGVMIDKCPVAGCWFHVQDRTATIKVDTKSAVFVVVKVPLQTPVTVTGKVVADGDDVALEATGVRY